MNASRLFTKFSRTFAQHRRVSTSTRNRKHAHPDVFQVDIFQGLALVLSRLAGDGRRPPRAGARYRRNGADARAAGRTRHGGCLVDAADGRRERRHGRGRIAPGGQRHAAGGRRQDACGLGCQDDAGDRRAAAGLRGPTLALNTPLAQLLPAIALDNPWNATDPVRLRHLLDHTAGLEDAGMRHVFNSAASLDSPLALAFRGRTASAHPSGQRGVVFQASATCWRPW